MANLKEELSLENYIHGWTIYSEKYLTSLEIKEI